MEHPQRDGAVQPGMAGDVWGDAADRAHRGLHPQQPAAQAPAEGGAFPVHGECPPDELPEKGPAAAGQDGGGAVVRVPDGHPVRQPGHPPAGGGAAV